MELKDILHVQTMCNDVFAVLKALYGDSPPAIVLVGHRLCSSVILSFCAYLYSFSRGKTSNRKSAHPFKSTSRGMYQSVN